MENQGASGIVILTWLELSDSLFAVLDVPSKLSEREIKLKSL